MADTIIVPEGTSRAINDIFKERMRQREIDYGGGMTADMFDREINKANDWVAYICAYAGRAGSCKRNGREGHDFRDMMVRVGALAAAAIEAYDRGFG